MINKNIRLKKGIFCISFDLDLLWGRYDLHFHPYLKYLRKNRSVFSQLIKLFYEEDIPATWATVGKLFLPASKNEKYADLLHAPDMIKTLRKYPNQEIGCHSFSHLEFNKISKTQAEEEIKNCLRVAHRQGLILKSFIFPRNKIDHLDILAKHGFQTYRGIQPDFENLPKPLQLLKLFSPFPPPVFTPQIEKQTLLNIPASFYFLSSRGKRKYIPKFIIANKVKRGINKAIDQKRIFHIWTHLEDLVDPKRFQLFQEMIKYAAAKRKEGELEIKNMGQIAKIYVKNNRSR